jgi:hypothetical protein
MKTVITILAIVAVCITAMACGSKKSNVVETSTQTQVEKLTETQIEKFVTSLEKPDYTYRDALFIEGTDYYISKMPQLSLGQLEDFLKIIESMNSRNNTTLKMKESVAASFEGGFDAAVKKYSSKPDEVYKNIAERNEYAQKFALLKSMLTSNIEKKRNQVFTVPKGDLIYYEDRTFGGMLPGTTYRLEKKDDGKTYLTSPLGWRGDTTIVVPDSTLAHVQKLFIDGKAYEVAPLYMTPYRIFDAPSWSMDSKFSSGERISSTGQQSRSGIKAFNVIEDYLREIAPKPKETDLYR